MLLQDFWNDDILRNKTLWSKSAFLVTFRGWKIEAWPKKNATNRCLTERGKYIADVTDDVVILA